MNMKHYFSLVGLNAILIVTVLLLNAMTMIYYIIERKENQWEFTNVGMVFSIISIAVPIGVKIIGMFTYPYHN